MNTLAGRRVALLESRLSEEIAGMVRRLGGAPVSAPAVQEVASAEGVGETLDRLVAGGYAVVVFLTGVGFGGLVREAERRGLRNETIAALRETTLACRGPKPIAAMKRQGLVPQVVTERPHTTRELLNALGRVDLAGRSVLLVHYGERNESVAAALRERGARLDEVCPYVWALPDDIGPLQTLTGETVAGRIDAMLFTSQIQCRHLFQVAAERGLDRRLADALNETVIVGAVGPVCAEALRRLGVTPDVIPSAPNMASLITALADYFDLTDRSGADAS